MPDELTKPVHTHNTPSDDLEQIVRIIIRETATMCADAKTLAQLRDPSDAVVASVTQAASPKIDPEVRQRLRRLLPKRIDTVDFDTVFTALQAATKIAADETRALGQRAVGKSATP